MENENGLLLLLNIGLPQCEIRLDGEGNYPNSLNVNGQALIVWLKNKVRLIYVKCTGFRRCVLYVCTLATVLSV